MERLIDRNISFLLVWPPLSQNLISVCILRTPWGWYQYLISLWHWKVQLYAAVAVVHLLQTSWNFRTSRGQVEQSVHCKKRKWSVNVSWSVMLAEIMWKEHYKRKGGYYQTQPQQFAGKFLFISVVWKGSHGNFAFFNALPVVSAFLLSFSALYTVYTLPAHTAGNEVAIKITHEQWQPW